MRRYVWALAAALVAATTLAGCPAAHSGYPGTSCATDNDCFKGEHCVNSTYCAANAGDMAIELPDLGHLGPDMATQASDMMSGDDL